jgi:transcriptional regulator with XRE-family HTH domain
MTPQPAWPDRLAAVIAGEVRRYRRLRGLTAQQVADRCADLGHDVPRSVLANLESGRRTTVTVAELLVLAAALEVSPVLLVFPLGRRENIEFLPGVERSTWSVVEWFSGHGDYPAAVLPEDDDQSWSRLLGYREPVELFARHEEVVQRWRAANGRVHVLRRRARTENGDIAAVLATAEETVDEIAAGLQDLRKQFSVAGLTPPGLAGELADRLGEARTPVDRRGMPSSLPYEPPEGGEGGEVFER